MEESVIAVAKTTNIHTKKEKALSYKLQIVEIKISLVKEIF